MPATFRPNETEPLEQLEEVHSMLAESVTAYYLRSLNPRGRHQRAISVVEGTVDAQSSKISRFTITAATATTNIISRYLRWKILGLVAAMTVLRGINQRTTLTNNPTANVANITANDLNSMVRPRASYAIVSSDGAKKPTPKRIDSEAPSLT
jgi:hypothetical protein